jgi:hypothetical protein
MLRIVPMLFRLNAWFLFGHNTVLAMV